MQGVRGTERRTRPLNAQAATIPKSYFLTVYFVFRSFIRNFAKGG